VLSPEPLLAEELAEELGEDEADEYPLIINLLHKVYETVTSRTSNRRCRACNTRNVLEFIFC
jgi:hypothetical protein